MTEIDPTTSRSETNALHAGQKADPTTRARAVPVHLTTRKLMALTAALSGVAVGAAG